MDTVYVIEQLSPVRWHESFTRIWYAYLHFISRL